MKFLRKFRSAEEYAEYISTVDSSNMHLMPTISLLAFGDEEKPKVGYVNADLTFKFTTEMEYEERWFSSRGGGGGVEGYSISTFEGVSGQTSGGIVKQAYLDGKLYYVNNGNIYDGGDGGGSSPHSLRYNASISGQTSGWDGIIVKEPGQHILQLVLDKTGVEDEFIVGNTGFMNIDELYIDDTITGLGEYFIDGNVGTLYVPETVSYIYSNALGNDALSIQIHENNPYIESISNGNGLVHKDSGTLFYVNKNVTEFTIPEGIKGIADSVFYYASDLVSITFPSTLEWIGDSAFVACSKLTSLEIGSGCTSIGNEAFQYCEGLTSVEIGGGVTSIGYHTFYGCTGLTSIVIPDSVTSIGYGAFYNCSSLTNVVIPDSVTSIGQYAFQNCYGLTSVEIGGGVNSIDNYTFAYCSGLRSIVIPDSVTSINNSAFYQCSELTSVEIGSGCTSIDYAAFRFCSGLKEITCHAVTAPSITSYTFQNVKFNGTLYIPSGSDYSSWMNTNSYYLGYYSWFIREIGTELPELTLDGYDVAMLVQPATTGSTKICYTTSSIAEIKVNDTVLNTVSTGYTFNTPYEWNVVRIKYTDGVTSIPSSAFIGCTCMYDVKIADSITSIDYQAFYGCSGLTGELIIPDSVTSIGYGAFYGCSSLKNVVIGSGVTIIGNEAFFGCDGLTSVVIPDSVISIGNQAFQYCYGLTSVVIPDSVTSIGIYVFNSCSGLTSVVIGNGCTSIDDYAFYECSGLKSVEIGSGCTSIGGYAFQGCSGLTSLEIGSGVTSIGSYAFNGCSGLTSIVIPDSVTSIGDYVFTNGSGLESIIVSPGNTVYDSRENCNCIIETSTNTLIQGCNNSFIPDSVISIGYSAFSYCSGLESIVIGSGVTSIGNNAFSECSGLTSIVIPDSVTSIGGNAFSQCSGLTSIVIGSGCTSIDDYAFQACTGLTEIICHAVTAPSITNYTFYYVKYNGILYVPLGSDYSSWMSTSSYCLGYYGWTQQATYSPTECTSLSITADDVNGRATNTTIYWTAVTNGVDLDGNPKNNMTITGEAISSEFPQNTSETETVERTITFEYMGVTASTTITQGVWIKQNYTVNLNSQWRLSTSIVNPDSAVYEGVYESFSNKGVDSSAAIMYIDIVGYENFKFYVRSHAESSWDYVVVSNLDCTLSNGTTSGSNVKMTTSGIQDSGTAISNYTLVEYTGIDGGEHRISVMYQKDGSASSGTDQGYVLIPKNQ